MNRKQKEREEGVKEEEKKEAKEDGRKGLFCPVISPSPSASQPHLVTRISLFQPFIKASSKNHKFLSLTLTDKASPFLSTSLASARKQKCLETVHYLPYPIPVPLSPASLLASGKSRKQGRIWTCLVI